MTLHAKTNYVLIDYENVQPADLALLKDGPFKVRVFLGANQAKIPVALATALQPFGANAEYVLLEAAGSNALDFHIAYYIGLLSAQEPAAYYHIVSKDAGFDPLIAHLRSKGMLVCRSVTIAGLPYFRQSAAPAVGAQVETVVAHLIKMKTAKPRAHKTLLSTVNALFRKELAAPQLEALFAALCERGVVKLDGTKVSYDLPDGP